MGNSTNPQITCVIPTFNRGNLLKEAINSVTSQTFTDWELIIVDNNSTDNTYDIVSGYQQKDERIKYFNCTGKGPSAARNFGVSKASGQYIVFLDDDDISLPHRFETQLNAAKKSGKNFVVSGYEVRNRTTNKIISRKLNELRGFGAGFPSRWIISKELFDKCGGFDEQLFTMEDPEFSYRVAQHEIYAYHISIVSIMYHTAASLSSGGKTIIGKVQMMEKSGQIMNPAEAAWWYFNIAQMFYFSGAFNETEKYFKLALVNDKRAYFKLAYIYFNLIKCLSDSLIIKKVSIKLFSYLGNKFPRLVEHPVVS